MARVVRNTGLHGLSLVGAGDWRTIECWRTAWGAHEVLEQATAHATLGEALAGTHLSVAFTGRADGHPADVRDAAREVATLGDGQAAALVFGPETSGLTLDEIAACTRRARIPSHPAQPSLNLSHAVMVAAYEVFRAVEAPLPAEPRPLASHAEKDAAIARLLGALVEVGAAPAEGDAFAREWRALFARMDLSPREARLLEHLARRVAGARRRGTRE